MRMTTCVLVSFCLLLSLTSCKKEDELNKPAEPVLTLKSVVYNFQGSTERQTLTYGSSGQLSSIKADRWSTLSDSTSSQPYYTTTFNWSANGRLSKVSHVYAGSAMTYTLDFFEAPGHEFVRKGLFPISTAYASQNWLGFDSKGRVIADSGIAGGGFRKFTYDDNDNPIKIDTYIYNGSGSATLSHSWLCTYDQKKNPFYSKEPYFFIAVAGPYYHYQGKNNLLEEKIVYNGSTATQVSYSYQYNEQGYPISRTTNGEPLMYAHNLKYRY